MENKSWDDPLDNLRTAGVRSPGNNSLDGLGTSINVDDNIENLRIGDLFGDRYQILSEGKRGGMGVVYKCSDKKLDNSIKALKVIHPKLVGSKHAAERFRREVSISQNLLHNNIVRVYDLDEYNGVEFFTMEWIDGGSLKDMIDERKRENRPFTLEEANGIISQLSDALSYAHQHTVHRDIKPENILISERKEGGLVKLTDFGIAKMLSPSQFTTASLQMGTPYYMAPEQKEGSAHVDKRADIYSMGVVLFELLTLGNTIGLELPSRIDRKLPEGIDNILKKTLATKPEDRYANVKEVSRELDRLVARKGAGLSVKRASIGLALLATILIIGIVFMTSLQKETSKFIKESKAPVSSGFTKETKAEGKERGKEGSRENSISKDNPPSDLKTSEENVKTFQRPEIGVAYKTNLQKEAPMSPEEARSALGSQPTTETKGDRKERSKKEVREYYRYEDENGVIHFTNYPRDPIPQKRVAGDPMAGRENVAAVQQSEKGAVSKRVSEFKSLINTGLMINPGKPNVALVIESPRTDSGLSPENVLYNSLKKDKINVIINLFKEESLKAKGYFKEIFDGNTDLLSQSNVFSQIDSIILGRLNYTFRKGSEIDKDLVSCNINLSYKAINKNGNITRADSLSVVGPGYNKDTALERGLEILSEKYFDRIFQSAM